MDEVIDGNPLPSKKITLQEKIHRLFVRRTLTPVVVDGSKQDLVPPENEAREPYIISETSAKEYVVSILTTPLDELDKALRAFKGTPAKRAELVDVIKMRKTLSQKDLGRYDDSNDKDRKKKGVVMDVEYDDVILLHRNPTPRETDIISKVVGATRDELSSIPEEELRWVRGLIKYEQFMRNKKRGINGIIQTRSNAQPKEEFLLRDEVEKLNNNLDSVINYRGQRRLQSGHPYPSNDPLLFKTMILRNAEGRDTYATRLNYGKRTDDSVLTYGKPQKSRNWNS